MYPLPPTAPPGQNKRQIWVQSHVVSPSLTPHSMVILCTGTSSTTLHSPEQSLPTLWDPSAQVCHDQDAPGLRGPIIFFDHRLFLVAGAHDNQLAPLVGIPPWSLTPPLVIFSLFLWCGGLLPDCGRRQPPALSSRVSITAPCPPPQCRRECFPVLLQLVAGNGVRNF